MAYYKLIRLPADGKTVRGRLYQVTESRFEEVLTPICDTMENADYLIPALIYGIGVTQSPKFKRLLPIVRQVPGRTGIRFIGVPENFNFWGERRARETYRCDEVASQSEGFERDKGCILVSSADEHELTARWLAEQSIQEEIRLEICDAN